MSILKKYIQFSLLSILLANNLNAQTIFDKGDINKDSLLIIKHKIESYPDSIPLHKKFIELSGILNKNLLLQYRKWVKEFPNSYIVSFIIGDTLAEIEQPTAQAFLLTTIVRKPNLAKAYYRLAFDSDRRGDSKNYSNYLLKATMLEPQNADYAFYYCSSLFKLNKELWEKKSLEIAQQFKNNQRGRQALFILADKISDSTKKLNYFKWLHDDFDKNSSWYRVGMEDYYNLLLLKHPRLALELAQEMILMEKYKPIWSVKVNNAQLLLDAKEYLVSNPEISLNKINKVKILPHEKSLNNIVFGYKIEALNNLNRQGEALAIIISSFKENPSNFLINQMISFGKKNNLSRDSLKQVLHDSLYSNASLATDFALKNYLTDKKVSLKNYNGHAILLTYWFPGCGPCRAEFPYFEKVIREFSTDSITYLGLNIDSLQNSYVLPFIKNNNYSFIPLQDNSGRNKGNLENGHSAPVNFIIDTSGYLLFSKFRISSENTEQLEIMLSIALGKDPFMYSKL